MKFPHRYRLALSIGTLVRNCGSLISSIFPRTSWPLFCSSFVTWFLPDIIDPEFNGKSTWEPPSPCVTGKVTVQYMWQYSWLSYSSIMMHQWNLERANICVLFYLHMQILSISHSISTTHVVQPRILYIIFSSFYNPESFALCRPFLRRKTTTMLWWPQNQKKRFLLPLQRFASQGGGRGIWWLGFPTGLRDLSIWGMPSQIGQVCYMWFLFVACKTKFEGR